MSLRTDSRWRPKGGEKLQHMANQRPGAGSVCKSLQVRQSCDGDWLWSRSGEGGIMGPSNQQATPGLSNEKNTGFSEEATGMGAL